MVAGIFCDLQKAFDCINRNIFINWIRVLWNNMNGIHTISSYLEGRYPRVVLNNISLDSCSNWGEIKHGVPQGSLLGPPLFKFTLTTYL
jgi:hypothetical protein